ncbi:MAG TPA: ATP-binding protein, partial [Mucilaginibacter sp.]
MVTEINWAIFETKFHEREQAAFERLAYFLFCFEFHQPAGIFRFKNQTGIETEPVKVGVEVIGFQAKFYKMHLASQQKDIIDSLTKAKAKNPDLTQLVLYVNLEMGEHPHRNKKQPGYKTAIENAAQHIKISILWRVPSHIEKLLAVPENHYLGEYFFGTVPGLVTQLNELDQHSKLILRPIKTRIPFQNKFIEVKRPFDNLNKALHTQQIVLISGEGGSGKTAFIKDWYAKLDTPCYVFKATEFRIDHLEDLFGKRYALRLTDFHQAHQDEPLKSIVIDSAEILPELANEEPFREFLTSLIENQWKVVFTTRDSYLDNLSYLFMR